MVRSRSVTCKLRCGEYVHHLFDDRLTHAFLRQDRRDILLIQVGSGNRQTIAQVRPCRLFYRCIEHIFVVRLQGFSSGFQAFLRYLIGLFVFHTRDICVLLNLLAQENKNHRRQYQRYRIEQP